MGNGIPPREPPSSPQVEGRAARTVAARAEDSTDEIGRLIQAGVDEMTEKSSLDPRVCDIVRRSGLSNKAFYRHFKSKEELLVAVLERRVRTLARQFEEQIAVELAPLERVRAWLWGVLDQALDPERAAVQRPLLVYQGRLLDRLGPELRGHVARMIGLLQGAIAEARDAGELPPTVDPVRDGEAIFHLAIGWMYGRVVGRVTPPREEAERVVSFALRGLGHADGAS